MSKQDEAIDMFSGAGGMAEGSQRAGVRVIWSANHNDQAMACHQANHPHAIPFQQDLAEADWTAVPWARLATASPACQGHSQNGQPARKGTGGSHRPDAVKLRLKGQRDRNTAYAVLAMCDSLRPERLLVENVCDFEKWEGFEPWLAFLNAYGYATQVHTLNGLNFGGFQDRPRTIITGNLGGEKIELDPGDRANGGSIADCLDADDAPANRWHSIASKPVRMRPLIRKAQRQAGSRCFWNNVSQSRGRSLEEPFPTATTGSGSQWNFIDGDRIRVMNPRELARSMSFPETYKFPRARGITGRLVGNAIDVKLAASCVAQVMAA